MTAEERELRSDLSRLAGTERGRALLQLSLRGIHHGEQAVTAGCWRDHGVAGCLFQHAYWQGVQEGVFRPVEGDPKGEFKSYVGEEDFALVMGAIRAFDALGKRRFRHWTRSRARRRRHHDGPAAAIVAR